MAILLREEGLLERTIIYATDINPASLDKAKQGIFSLENVRAYTANYQQAGGQRSFADYYTAAYDYAIFDKTLRATPCPAGGNWWWKPPTVIWTAYSLPRMAR